MKKTLLSLFVFSLLCCRPLFGAAPQAVAELVRERALASAVRVEFYLQRQVGDSPVVRLASDKCPNCGRFHSQSFDDNIRFETPYIVDGFAISSNDVICQDVCIPDGNVRRLNVRRGAEIVPAKVVGIFKEQAALRLRLEEPLVQVMSLGSNCSTGECAFIAQIQTRLREKGESQFAVVSSYDESVRQFDSGEKTLCVTEPAAIFDKEGCYCGLVFSESDVAASADPSSWAEFSPAELAELQAKIEARALRAAWPVSLTFREERRNQSGMNYFDYRSERTDVLAFKTLGIPAGNDRLLVVLPPKREVISRLSAIEVTPLGGQPIEAEFLCVHKHADFLVAKLKGEVSRDLGDIVEEDVASHINRLFFAVRLSATEAGTVIVKSSRVRVNSLSPAWRSLAMLESPLESDEATHLFYTPSEELIFASIGIVPTLDTFGDNDEWKRKSCMMTLAAKELAWFANPTDSEIDLALRPVASEDDGAIGWLGLELQPMSPKLADMLAVMPETDGGEYGAIVARVHDGSAAAAAGVEEGWIILAVRAAGTRSSRKVLIRDLSHMNYRIYGMSFWDMLESVPDEYADSIPAPWPNVKNDFTSQLYKLGVGSKIEVDFIVNGEKTTKEMEISLGPKYFENAPSYEWKAGGLTVCDMTFEVREFLNLAEDAPGVVVSKLKSSGKASVAGVLRFEVVRTFNGAPISDVEAFKAAVEANSTNEVVLQVLRMSETRVVQIAR